MKTWAFGISILLFITSCSLNGKQEAALSKALTDYLRSRNESNSVLYISFQMPCVVAHYKSLGDSVFLAQYDLVNNTSYNGYWDNFSLKKIVTDDKNIQVAYELDALHDTDNLSDLKKVKLFALSDDDGENWFFMENEVYNDSTICKNIPRLLN